MQIKTDLTSFFVFDLDDTLFQEIDFLKSAYSHISAKLAANISVNVYEQMLLKYRNKENVFEWLVSKYQQLVPGLNVQWLLKEYREHAPSIKLSEASLAFMLKLKNKNIPLGLITDGRSTTQRNKLKALGIDEFFQDIIISEEFGSEKPDERNYLYFESKYPEKSFYFFGDNTSKDFIVPLKLGWTTFCIKNAGDHIHTQSFDKYPQPDYIISGFDQIEII
jgi:putative hydrolase of the HAD superfamily